MDQETTVRKTSSFIPFFLIFLAGLLSGILFFIGGTAIGWFSLDNKEKLESTQSNQLQSSLKSEKNPYYTVSYPNNFFISYKTIDLFRIANQKWEGEIFNFPQTGIRIYSDIVPEKMNLKSWLDGLSDPHSALEDPSKSCTNFINNLYQQTKASVYQENQTCWFLGVKNITATKVSPFSALEFKTANVSTSTIHTIFLADFDQENKNGNSRVLVDIFLTTTSHSTQDDQTAESYKTLLDTFQLRKN